MPLPRGTRLSSTAKGASFRPALATDVGAPGWRQVWAAFDARDAIAGHVDLRGHGEPNTEHRALLGLGVHRRNHRGRRLGRALLDHTVSWAVAETALDWIDLDVLDGNVAAERLYRGAGFVQVAFVPDQFPHRRRVGGQPDHEPADPGVLVDLNAVTALMTTDSNAYNDITQIKTWFDPMIGPVTSCRVDAGRAIPRAPAIAPVVDAFSSSARARLGAGGGGAR